ncbi:MAG: hypothetical protein M0R30_06155 [Methanoregula sp.]|uniref:Eco57I restriction-modification methylase domain-containing protein n=1 Tax=Methanoregula sp. TaxID=2052170 RepID=UPI0025CF79D0|nr:hypothetical protein [Methanoregula sp.]MCK9631209.1 hypothetical protein [Methanoregula sp.]
MRAPIGSDTGVSPTPSDKGTVLLTHFESARDLLARRLVSDYHSVTDPDINYLTISSILQVLFLRTGQDCGFVEPGTLAALTGCDGIAKRMGRACTDAGLSPDLFFEKGPRGTRTFPAIPDEPLRRIIGMLDQPDLPAPLTSLTLEDLAGVLDRFLGTRMQLGEGFHVNRVGKSAMLYTGVVDVPPQTVVEYVVSGAVGGISDSPAMSGRTAARVLDLACGSGLFLLAAYRSLVRKKIRALDRPDEMQAVLSDLAVSAVFGTDIDPESVSAARMVLLFAFIEESRRPGSGVVSPDTVREISAGLTRTIRSGNSLIAPDYFSGKPVFPFNADERRKVNAFDWKEVFPGIMAGGGFDAVIGAPPPYRPFAVKAREEYFQTHYDAYAPATGLYGYFIERALSLLKPGAIMTVLVPGTFLRSQNARPLRRLLLSRQIVAITSTGRTRYLPEGEVPVYALSLRNQPPEGPFLVVPEWAGSGSSHDIRYSRHAFTLDQRSLDDGGWRLDDTRTIDILEKIQARGTPLDDYVMGEVDPGTHRVKNNPLVVDTATMDQLTTHAVRCRQFFVPLLRPADIRRYVPERPERFVLSIRDNRKFRKCRALVAYLEKNAGGWDKKPGPDEGNENPDAEERRPKIIFSSYQQGPAFCFDREGRYAITQTLLAIPRNDPFLAGVLNSTLARFVLTRTCPLTDRGYHISPAALGKFPVYVPDFDRLAEKSRHDRMVSLVSHILELNHYLPQAKTDQERRLVQQEIDATDVRIDALVYELYGLTPEEISVVEASS